jgi:hypothetical protein
MPVLIGIGLLILLTIFLPKGKVGKLWLWVGVAVLVVIGIVALTPFLLVAVIVAAVVGVIWFVIWARKKVH